jgi:cytochrome c oxidase subunit 2
MVLPLGETTRIELSASDVNHGFWVPAFYFKRDAIAGQTTDFDLTPNKLGTFSGRCSSFCGLDHALMLFSVRVVTPRDFARWQRSVS